jgi:hypothetical protein
MSKKSQEPHECEKCGKEFNSRQGKWNHKQKCKGPNSISDLQQKHLELLEKYNKLLEKKNIGNDNTITNIQGNNNVVINKTVVNYFRYEDKSYINDDDMIDMLKEEELGKSYYQFVSRVFLNKDHPENATCFIDDIQDGYGFLYTRRGWVRWDVESLVKHLLENVSDSFADIAKKFEGHLLPEVNVRLSRCFAGYHKQERVCNDIVKLLLKSSNHMSEVYLRRPYIKG